MLAQEPELKLIGAEHFTHHQVIRPVVAEHRCAFGQRTNLANDDLVSIHQS